MPCRIRYFHIYLLVSSWVSRDCEVLVLTDAAAWDSTSIRLYTPLLWDSHIRSRTCIRPVLLYIWVRRLVRATFSSGAALSGQSCGMRSWSEVNSFRVFVSAVSQCALQGNAVHILVRRLNSASHPCVSELGAECLSCDCIL